MLKGIDPILNADMLFALASMGHGDELVVVDANFPAYTIAHQTTLGAPIMIASDALSVLKAILTLFPIDTFDLEIAPVRGMAIVDQPNAVPEIVADAQSLFEPLGNAIKLVERHAFYADAAKTYVIIQTNETRLYGNFIIRKGVVA